MVAGLFGGNLATGMMVVVPAILIFLLMTILLPETRGRELAVSTPPQPRHAAA